MINDNVKMIDLLVKLVIRLERKDQEIKQLEETTKAQKRMIHALEFELDEKDVKILKLVEKLKEVENDTEDDYEEASPFWD